MTAGHEMALGEGFNPLANKPAHLCHRFRGGRVGSDQRRRCDILDGDGEPFHEIVDGGVGIGGPEAGGGGEGFEVRTAQNAWNLLLWESGSSQAARQAFGTQCAAPTRDQSERSAKSTG